MKGEIYRLLTGGFKMKIIKNEPNGVIKPDNGLEEYNRTKEKYLTLCRRYGLNPFDMDILNLGMSRIKRRDKVQMVRMILKLIRLERELKGAIGKGLFPLTVRESERSGYMVPSHRG